MSKLRKVKHKMVRIRKWLRILLRTVMACPTKKITMASVCVVQRAMSGGAECLQMDVLASYRSRMKRNNNVGCDKGKCQQEPCQSMLSVIPGISYGGENGTFHCSYST